MPLRLLLVLDDPDGTLEGELHDLFSSGRIRGEWFEPLTHGLVDYIIQQIRWKKTGRHHIWRSLERLPDSSTLYALDSELGEAAA